MKKEKPIVYEPEQDEVVEHDIVMVLRDGKFTEVTEDDA